MNSTYFIAVRHFEKVEGYLISATRASKYSTSCPVENTTRAGVHVHCIYHLSL